MRGQAHTLEAFVAALLVLGGVVFALQATAVTPLSASTSNQHIENQQQAQAQDLLAAAAANHTLRGAAFAADNDTVYTTGGPPNAFGRALEETFGASRVAFNVEVTGADRGRMVVVNQGVPTDNSVTASRPLVLFDDTPYPGHANVSAAAAAGAFNVSDASPSTELYATLEVHVTVWRI